MPGQAVEKDGHEIMDWSREPASGFGEAEQNSHDQVDAEDMYRMGKDQQFRRIFRLSTMIMFTSMVQCTWEVILIAPVGGLLNGGLPGLFYSYIWTFIGFMFIVMSLAEMASMAPTSGGQYHWVSEFAPARYQRILSYVSGWMATTSWQAGAAGLTFLIGTLIQGMIAAYDPSYIPKRWQGTLFVFAIAAIEAIVNSFMVNQLPRIQKIMIVPHGLGWMVVVVFVWVLAPHADAAEVFTQFTSLGWDNMGLSLMVGQITSVYFLILSDSAAHLAEEVRNASTSVPRAMMTSFYLNAIVGLIVLVTFLFAIPSIDNALDPAVNPSGYAFIYVFQQASYTGAIPIFTMMAIIMLVGSINTNASSARQVFAFARDGGLPFGKFISNVTQTKNSTAPRNAVLTTCTITCLLSLINIGSSVAFNAIISLQLMALMATYSISIGCVLYQRTLCGSKHLPAARWSLGKWGIPINTIAFIYSVFIFFWTPWPGAKDPTLETFNWSVVMFGAIAIISGIYYFFHGRRHYMGPVALVRDTSS
ncbi:hypothetical protein E2P81_ATG02279 [Venturia nashicola]|uniref:Amino acid transporter n=1 Tax=Venturia nashicola TaxID=86259 RepID=A0A4Z1PF68_9PEZI|nr:hypothetical protein E6O75_ATG02336 [Venturia nashicola]TLD36497.1 hypothetical protein E2P81_ATG02279 [Venturia nashicola]